MEERWSWWCSEEEKGGKMANDNDGAALGRHHPPWIPRPRMEGGSKEGGRLLAFLLGPTSAILARKVRNLMKVKV